MSVRKSATRKSPDMLRQIWKTEVLSLSIVSDSVSNQLHGLLRWHPSTFDANLAEDFIREVKAIGQRKSPAVLPIKRVAKTKTGVRVLFPLRSQKVWADASTKLKPQQRLQLLSSFASELDSLHETDEVHGYLTSQTVFVESDNRLCAVPFAPFHAVRDVAKRQQSENPKGNVQLLPEPFIAPEVLAGQKPTRFSDQYALGLLVLGSLVTQPITDRSQIWRSVQRVRDQYGHRLAAMLERVFNEQPEDRYANCRYFVGKVCDEFERWRQRRHRVRRRWLMAASLLLPLIVLPAGRWAIAQSQRSRLERGILAELANSRFSSNEQVPQQPTVMVNENLHAAIFDRRNLAEDERAMADVQRRYERWRTLLSSSSAKLSITPGNSGTAIGRSDASETGVVFYLDHSEQLQFLSSLLPTDETLTIQFDPSNVSLPEFQTSQSGSKVRLEVRLQVNVDGRSIEEVREFRTSRSWSPFKLMCPAPQGGWNENQQIRLELATRLTNDRDDNLFPTQTGNDRGEQDGPNTGWRSLRVLATPVSVASVDWEHVRPNKNFLDYTLEVKTDALLAGYQPVLPASDATKTDIAKFVESYPRLTVRRSEDDRPLTVAAGEILKMRTLKSSGIMPFDDNVLKNRIALITSADVDKTIGTDGVRAERARTSGDVYVTPLDATPEFLAELTQAANDSGAVNNRKKLMELETLMSGRNHWGALLFKVGDTSPWKRFDALKADSDEVGEIAPNDFVEFKATTSGPLSFTLNLPMFRALIFGDSLTPLINNTDGYWQSGGRIYVDVHRQRIRVQGNDRATREAVAAELNKN